MKRPASSSRPVALPPHTVAVVRPRVPYGAAELKRAMGPNLLKGLGVSALVAMLGLGTFAAVQARPDAEPTKPPIVLGPNVRHTPPPRPEDPRAKDAAPPKAAPDAPKVGDVTPVPDEQAPDTVRVADTRDFHNGPASPVGVDGGHGTTVGSGLVGPPEPPKAPEQTPDTLVTPPTPPAPPEEKTPPPPDPERIVEFFAVERQPEKRSGPEPTYPDLLRRAGIEGRVVVRVLIGRDGAVEEAEVLRSDHEGFAQGTLDAVRRWRFTPAIQAGAPVRVWMTIPVRYRQQAR